METKRLISFIAIAVAILIGWSYIFPPPPEPPKEAVTQASQPSATGNNAATSASTTSNASISEDSLQQGKRITVTTDILKATIDSNGADLRELVLSKHDATSDSTKNFTLMSDKKGFTYVAQTGFLPIDGISLPSPKTEFTSEKSDYTLTGDTLEVKFTAPEENGVQVNKIYTFTKNSYVIGIRYTITNNSGKTFIPSAYYRLLRDGHTPEGESKLAYTFTGPAMYTPEGKFQKISFGDLDSDFTNGKDSVEYVRKANTGWVGMLQHYFVSAWILEPKGMPSACGKSLCQFQINKRSDGLYSAGVIVPLTAVADGQTSTSDMTLFAGPETFKIITQVTNKLELSKDYGKVHIFSSPLFWLLSKLHDVVHNWGWAIVLLTIIVKLVLYPLTAASYRSMAKMRAAAPRLQELKAQYGDDRVKLQQAMMEMYKKEKINPLGGCLPIFLQIPVFIGLYWALFASVELRQAPWILWIHDLARPDPYYILPAIMAVTMYIQTFLNPPPPDPMQAKMMKIMPIAFSIMFFFFPAGLVLYWLVNNILSIAQQWMVNRSIQKKKIQA